MSGYDPQFEGELGQSLAGGTDHLVSQASQAGADGFDALAGSADSFWDTVVNVIGNIWDSIF